ncbi:NAD(P)/FAD-dependent oxidoreductase [Salipiger abyssi]|uniref:NAD(P)/FAD-dependent oxidoreductase n=1 Tax=Salipiger abyssi TaxID=1250539 RepID=UPI004058DB80
MTSDPQANLWRASAQERIDTARLSGDAATDLLVVGGGFTGCSAALEAARAGASVTLLEANTIGHGGSGRNVGLVNAGLWLAPDDVLAAAGQTDGTRLLTELGQGPQAVYDIIAREGIDCEATRNGTLHLAHAPSGLRDLENRYRQGNRTGAPLQLLDAAETARRTGSTAFHGALFDPRAGTIQPLAYARGLARAAMRAGARVHEGSAVTAIAHSDGVWRVRANGHEIRARALLLATNAYCEAITGAPLPRFVPVSFSQFATAPLPEEQRARILPGGEGCWDTAMVMSSLRIDAAGRLIVGGIGNAEGAGGKIHASWARRKLRALYPELGALPFEHVWRGSIAMTSDHIPKAVAFGPNALSIFGYSGRGIAPGTVFGRAAATALLNGTPEALPLPPIQTYTERFTVLREAYYELGAALTHATRSRG